MIRSPFITTNCTCLTSQDVVPGGGGDTIPVPEGYSVHSTNCMLKGLCPDCRRKTRDYSLTDPIILSDSRGSSVERPYCPDESGY